MAGLASMLSSDVLSVVFLLLISALFLGSWRKSQHQKRKLPPGDGWSMPLIGETLAFLKQPHKFLDQKRVKYGGVFRTSIFGQTSAVLSTPESARFVLVQAHKSFKNGYRPSIARIVDPARCFVDSELNSRVRKLLAATLGPENVRDSIPAYDALTVSVIDAWEGGATLNTNREMEAVSALHHPVIGYVLSLHVYGWIEPHLGFDTLPSMSMSDTSPLCGIPGE